MRIGMGYDVHQLVRGRVLIIGGVEIPYPRGLAGHSDADVLLHAICDALLGAVALGDIGSHFPDTDARWKGADSRELLRKVNTIVLDTGYKVVNIDSTIALERPKLHPYIDAIRQVIAQDLDLDPGLVSVKATTSEKLGMVGREEGAAAWAVCLLHGI
ncbi:MAG: 2-C-methyl-D-erythritol 2,4-cyclodiphosphate synthase [Bacteroidetes bacterium]|nr:2-C-methyl-D-erythritol 2,4-cyclodiphosphate synthase [Bacteroidota bacterium]